MEESLELRIVEVYFVFDGVLGISPRLCVEPIA